MSRPRVQIRAVRRGKRYDLWRWHAGRWRRWTWWHFDRANGAGEYAIQRGYQLDQTGVGDVS